MQAAAAAGYDRVVEALLHDHTALLRKHDALFLAGVWGVRSYIWRRKGAGGRKAPAEESGSGTASGSGSGSYSDLAGGKRQRSDSSGGVTTASLDSQQTRSYAGGPEVQFGAGAGWSSRGASGRALVGGGDGGGHFLRPAHAPASAVDSPLFVRELHPRPRLYGLSASRMHRMGDPALRTPFSVVSAPTM